MLRKARAKAEDERADGGARRAGGRTASASLLVAVGITAGALQELPFQVTQPMAGAAPVTGNEAAQKDDDAQVKWEKP